MKLALREDMSRGGTLAEQIAWLEGLGFDGIELSAGSLDLPLRELEEIFADSPVRAANIPGSGALLDPDPAERTAAKELMRRRLNLAATLGAVDLLTVRGLVPEAERETAAARRQTLLRFRDRNYRRHA
jgi:sugar phosphate isomerase/epimerase